MILISPINSSPDRRPRQRRAALDQVFEKCPRRLQRSRKEEKKEIQGRLSEKNDQSGQGRRQSGQKHQNHCHQGWSL